MNFAVIENGIVENTIVADSKEIAEQLTGKTCIGYTSTNVAHIGYGHNGSTFEQPVFKSPTEDK